MKPSSGLAGVVEYGVGQPAVGCVCAFDVTEQGCPVRIYGLRVIALMVSFAIGGCSQQAPVGPAHEEPLPRTDRGFEIRLIDYGGASGCGFEHRVTPHEYTILALDDREPHKLLAWQSRLTDEQRLPLARCISEIPWRELKPQYVNQDVWDGFEINLEVTIDTEPTKEILVANTYQPELGRLTDVMDRIVPSAYRIRHSKQRENQ